MIIDNFVGFIATVVDIDGVDENFGKIKIRIYGDSQSEHSILDEDLLWATVMMPATSTAYAGIGTSPNWISKNATVFGIFFDGKYRNLPLIMGTINQNRPDVGRGISEIAASGQEPRRGFTDIENKLNIKNSRRPNYKDNKVITTASKELPTIVNHVIEIDDTPTSERMLIKHKNGTYVEMLPDGTIIVKSQKNNDEITINNKNVFVKGDIYISSEKTIKITSKQSIEMAAPGGLVVTDGAITAKGLIASGEGATGTFTSPDGKIIMVSNGLITKITG